MSQRELFPSKANKVYFPPDVVKCLETIMKEKDLPIDSPLAEYAAQNAIAKLRTRIGYVIERGTY